MSEIHRADPTLRRYALIVVVMSGAAGIAGFVMFQRWFADVQGLPPDQAWTALMRILMWVSAIMLVLVVITSVYALRLGATIKQTNQYPPLGTRTIRDTVITQGKSARSRGNLLQATGALLLVLAVLLLFLCSRLVNIFSATASA